MMNLKILLVEDNESWQDSLQEDITNALRRMGYSESNIELVESFNQAYQVLKKDSWDLLVTDIGLGGSDKSHQNRGRQLVKLACERKIPVIVVSGTPSVTNQDVRNLLLQDGASDFFSKPTFDDEKFIEKVQELLQKHSGSSDSPIKDIFLIHASENQQGVAKPLIDAFNKTNISYWIDKVENDVNHLSSYQAIPNKSKQESSQSQPIEFLIDFAIITAIEVESRAVCKALGLTDKNRVKKESRVYWQGRLNLKDGEFYEIVVAQSPDMANVDAALLTSDTIHHWHPESILMVAIAGAASEEEKSGDLILGSHVYYYERGKETPGGNKPEPYMYPSDATLWSRIISLPKWTARISVKRPDGTKERPKIYQGVIASGERVIADAAVRDEIKVGQRKIRAIEMEGYGFSKAAWQSYNRVRHLVIRAICDSADPNKNDEWHLYAATVAAEFTKHFLSDRPLVPRNSPKS